MKEQEEYKQDHDRKKHLNNIWRADDIFIEKARTQNDDSIMGNIASKLISSISCSRVAAKWSTGFAYK